MWYPIFFLLKGNECTTFSVTENIIKLAKGLVDFENLWMTRVQHFQALCMCVCVCVIVCVCVCSGLHFVTPIWLLCGHFLQDIFTDLYLTGQLAVIDNPSLMEINVTAELFPSPIFCNRLQRRSDTKCVWRWGYSSSKRHLPCDLCQAIRLHEMILFCLFFSSLFRFL